MPVTVQDIAKRLNLSKSLVSGVLNGTRNIRSSEETRHRIEEAAREMRYQPSRSARALVTGKSRQIAFPYLNLDRADGTPGIADDPAEGILIAAAQRHYTTLILPFDSLHTSIYDVDMLVHSHGCDGICLDAAGCSQELYEYMRQQSVPFVILGNPGFQGVSWVDIDNHRYAYDSVAWLAAQGHQRIGFVDFVNDQLYIQVLHQGYQDAMRELCGGFDGTLVFKEIHMKAAAMRDFITQPNRPTALIARDPVGALYWRTIALESGFRVPEDMAILVHTPPVIRTLLPPDLTCHEHEPNRVGMLAAHVLIDWIEKGTAPVPGPILVPPLMPQACGRQ